MNQAFLWGMPWSANGDRKKRRRAGDPRRQKRKLLVLAGQPQAALVESFLRASGYDAESATTPADASTRLRGGRHCAMVVDGDAWKERLPCSSCGEP
jgi:hypothetical protein